MHKPFYKRKKFIVLFIIILLISGGVFYAMKPKNVDLSVNAATAKKGDIIQTVSVSGKVKPTETVNLSFEKSGRIDSINVQVGDKVSAGQIIASLNNTDALAMLQQAQAQLANQQAQLESLKKGTRQEEIQITESDIKKAQQDLTSYYNNTFAVINEAYTKADDAVRKQTSVFFTAPETINPLLNFTTINSQLTTDSQFQKRVVNTELETWRTEIRSIESDQNPQNIDTELQKSITHLKTIIRFLNTLSEALSNAGSISQGTLETYKTNLNTARTSTNAALTSINSQIQTIAAQKVVIEKFQNQLTLQKAGNTTEQIAAQEAQVNNAKANVLNYQAQLEKSHVRSPINGVITKQDAQKGEIISANNAFISIISDSQFEIEANIPEADIAKIKTNNPASVTLDAYGDDIIFNAVVTKIDPAETILEGVATYKTTFHFVNKDERIRSGMTANIDIEAAKKTGVIHIPQRAVFTENKEKFVKLINSDNKTTTDTKIETGLRGSDGNIEIIKGLNEGDKILTALQAK